MYIERNGIKYTLTQDELFEAYEEQQHIWDYDYCKSMLDELDARYFRSEYGISKTQAKEMLDDIAYEMRQQIDKYDIDDDDARDVAFRTIIADLT